MDDEKAKQHVTKDYLFKKFRQNLNVWLKDVGAELGLAFNLYAYVFRHTAITVALDNGLPTSYVAMAAGTSIEVIQQHYYNGNSIANRNKLQMAFIKAGI
jgi:integrase